MKKRVKKRVSHLRSERTENEMGEKYGSKGVRSGGGELSGVD